MPAYDPKSRYAKVPTYRVVDHRDRLVNVTPSAPPPEQPIAGWHVRREGQRPDHLAAHYLDDPTGFWRLAEANDAIQAEWLTEQADIAIPVKDS